MGVMKRICESVGMRELKRRPRMVKLAVDLACCRTYEEWDKGVQALPLRYTNAQVSTIRDMAHAIRINL